jgi:hypothetical protein
MAVTLHGAPAAHPGGGRRTLEPELTVEFETVMII